MRYDTGSQIHVAELWPFTVHKSQAHMSFACVNISLTANIVQRIICYIKLGAINMSW
jgi:hypothetical protein